MASVLRLAVAAIIILLVARSARTAWQERRLAVAVWRRIRPRHIAGSLVLLGVVLTVTLALMELAPVTSFGLGTLIGLTGNAVFAPAVEATSRGAAVSGPAADTARQVAQLATVVFLTLLLLLIPWLAYVEEQVFREGLERAGPLRRAAAALRFGLAHLVMLVPIAAALGISVAGLWYGRMYVAGYRRAAGDDLVPPGDARAVGVLNSTVWHTAFNSTLVVLVVVGLATGWMSL